MPRSIKRAHHIITISENSKKDIMEVYKVPESKISIVHNGVDHDKFYPRSAAQIAKVKKTYNLPDKYIHFHGTIEPRKNVQGLLDAYASLEPEIQKQYGLVLSGGKGWKDEEIQTKIQQLQNRGLNVVLTGYIHGDDELPAIYSGASLFVWPTFYEGFGVPPLEAMACGVPVITSDNSSLPEVVGNAAVKVRAKDTPAIAQAMAKLLANSKLTAELSRKGLVQAKKFTWEKSAEQLIRILKNL